MATQTVELALDARADLGEGPRWHAGERLLYWVDIARKQLHRFDPATGADELVNFDDPVGCFAFREKGGLVLAMKDGMAFVDRWTAEPYAVGEQIFADKPDLRFNDGRTDSKGRFWVGSVNMTKNARDAALYRFDPDLSLHFVEGGMLTCNAAAFSVDGTDFRHADTPSHELRGYAVDPDTGTLSGRRIVKRFPEGRGRPDGGSFDVQGNYWSALFDGGRVVKLSGDGEILATVELPVTRPTMIAFGGEDLRTAYVTSARTGLSDAQLANQPHAGGIFAFHVDVPGLPEVPFAG